MSYYECYGDPARIAEGRASRDEAAKFRQRYEEISKIMKEDGIAIRNFLSEPPKGKNDFIRNKYNDDRGAIHEFLTPKARMQDDIRTEAAYEEKYTTKSKTAVALEYIFGIGVKAGGWLGVEADARATTLYDDVRHRIDEVVTIYDDDGNPYPFGVDVTTTIKPEIISDKLSRHHNDSSLELPIGCSQLIYYEHEAKKRSLPCIPRYVVSIDSESVERIVRTSIDIIDGNITINPNAPNILDVRWHILSELSAQAALYLKQFPKPEAQSNLEADALIAIAAQQEIFEAGIKKIEETLNNRRQSDGRLRNGGVYRPGEDKAYTVLMNEINSLDRGRTNQNLGKKTASMAKLRAS